MLKVESDAIQADKIEKTFGFVPPPIYIVVDLRLCLPGEYQGGDQKCLPCSDGFYTLLPDQEICAPCPDNARCANGKDISVKDGFWRKGLDHTEVFECYNKGACLGGLDSECADGYGGNLCHSCQKVGDTYYNKQAD